MQPKWRVYVAYQMHGRTSGEYCGEVGLADSCHGQEDGWDKAINWLKGFRRFHSYLLYTPIIKVRYF